MSKLIGHSENQIVAYFINHTLDEQIASPGTVTLKATMLAPSAFRNQ